MTPKKILCAVDFSAPSQVALEAATELALKFGATLSLLHVDEIPVLVLPPAGILLPSTDATASAKQHMARLCDDARRAGVPTVDAASIEGVPWREIVAYAKEAGHDLIIVGTHGRTGLAHVVLGSTAERVVQHAHCSVLTVRSAAA